MVTLWGAFGTAKSMTVQAVVAELVRQRKPARFAHAKTIEQRWYEYGEPIDHQVDHVCDKCGQVVTAPVGQAPQCECWEW